MNCYCDARLFVRSVRSGGDGRPAAVLPRAARSPPACTTSTSGTRSRCPGSPTSGRCWNQRRDIRRFGGHAARRNGFGAAQRRAGPRPAAASDAVSRELRRSALRERPSLHVGAVPAEVRRPSSRPGSALWPTSGSTSCCRAARFDLTQEYGGIVAASVVCELVGLPVDLAPEVLATVNAGSLAQPGSGVEVANARPGYLEYLIPARASARRADGLPARLRLRPSSTASSDTGCPTARRSPTSRPRRRCSASSSAERKRCRRSSRTDCGS